MKKEWVTSIRDQSKASGVSFFFKQWGGVRKAKNGRLLDGRTYDEYPERSIAPVPLREECMGFGEIFLHKFGALFQRPSLVRLQALSAS